MFAPYCESCDRRILLSCSDIVRFVSDGVAPHVVVLRCVCGRLLDWGR
ncbi:MAG: hypothetical protein ACRDY7_09040 [Acidimicrobiia bacterium]